jgi:isocitrate/isopropylmalate dehydrogenase
VTEQRIAVIPGDGIGGEVIASARAVLDDSLAKRETRTADLGGTASTAQVTEALVAHLRRSRS